MRPEQLKLGAPVSERPAGPSGTGEPNPRRLPMRCFAGIDWASADHAVCVIDEHANVLYRAMVAHTGAGLADLVRALRKFGPPVELPVAIERPSGLLVDTLVEAGFQVVPIHPNAVKASRPRYAAAHSKTDLGDAFMLADLLRTDGHRFQPLRPHSDG